MTPDRDAYATLGLRPGAARAQVNDAYRRLMKMHHPDRPGGDAGRAAEITHAYSLIRRRLGEPVRVPIVAPVRRRRRRFTLRDGGSLFVLILVAAAGLAALQRRDVPRSVSYTASVLPSQSDRSSFAGAPDLAGLDQPVQPQVVNTAVSQAIRFHFADDDAGASAFSSDCQKAFRRKPNVSWFDACAAFDEAMLTLGTDNSDFSEPAVMVREVSAATLISDSSLEADAHLHQVRSLVDMQILPMLDSAATLRP